MSTSPFFTKDSDALRQKFRSLIIAQDEALEAILPYVFLHRSRLASEGRPVGVFILVGPTGTGKTRTVEALAEVIHGSDKNVLRVDCGEFQSDHEAAKLIGAPPGYLGHRETQPLLTQIKLNAVTSERSNLSLVLFDEIEKAAPSVTRLLLGVLDKAILRLGDNTSVNFEHSMIFMTSNIGAKELENLLSPKLGFGGGGPVLATSGKFSRTGEVMVRRSFPPEFMNRIDRVITYRPLDESALRNILSMQMTALQLFIDKRLEANSFHIELTPEATEWLIERGCSTKWGARELKRLILREITQRIATKVMDKELNADHKVRVLVADEHLDLAVEPK